MTINRDLTALIIPQPQGRTGLDESEPRPPIPVRIGRGVLDPADAQPLIMRSPLTMVITSTVERSIPVPTGATELIIEDVTAYNLVDAVGNVYQITAVEWP
jgi:hypothetical protein